MSAVRFVERDRGFAALLKRVDEFKNTRLTVGIHEREGAEQRAEGGATLAEIAGFQHNGTATIPPRPFLDLTFEPNEERIRKMKKRVAQEILAGRLTVEQGMNLLGVQLAGMVKQTIKDGIPPELQSREGTPLIDTGQLIGAIKHEVSGV